MSSNSEPKKGQDTDKTDGIVWQRTKPQLISRNLSAGNLQSLEKGASESTNAGGGPNQLAQIKEQSRKSSLPMSFMGNVSFVESQRPRGNSFFKELVGKYDVKKEQGR